MSKVESAMPEESSGGPQLLPSLVLCLPSCSPDCRSRKPSPSSSRWVTVQAPWDSRWQT